MIYIYIVLIMFHPMFFAAYIVSNTQNPSYHIVQFSSQKFQPNPNIFKDLSSYSYSYDILYSSPIGSSSNPHVLHPKTPPLCPTGGSRVVATFPGACVALAAGVYRSTAWLFGLETWKIIVHEMVRGFHSYAKLPDDI